MPSPPRDPKNPVPPPSAETSSKPQSPVPEDGIALTPLPSPLENAACPTPAPPDVAEEPAPPSMAIVIANRLDRDAVRGGVVTGKGGFGVAPQSQRRPRWPRRVAGWLRIAALVLCMIAFSVMASDKTEGWAGDSFDRYKEFRYLVAVNVIGFVYSAFQVYESYYRGVTMMYMGRRTRYFIHLLMDQALAYLLMSASSAAASRSDVWVSRFGSDAFTHKANGSVAVSFLAFIVLALTSIISAYNYFFIYVGIMVSPTIFARRCLSYLMSDMPQPALNDAMQALVISPTWPTAFYLQAAALLALVISLYNDAREALKRWLFARSKKECGALHFA